MNFQRHIKSPDEGYVFLAFYAVYQVARRNQKVSPKLLSMLSDVLGFDDPKTFLQFVKKTKINFK